MRCNWRLLYKLPRSVDEVVDRIPLQLVLSLKNRCAKQFVILMERYDFQSCPRDLEGYIAITTLHFNRNMAVIEALVSWGRRDEKSRGSEGKAIH